jgi:hypothetical protein
MLVLTLHFAVDLSWCYIVEYITFSKVYDEDIFQAKLEAWNERAPALKM